MEFVDRNFSHAGLRSWEKEKSNGRWELSVLNIFPFLPTVVFPPALYGPCKAFQPKTLLVSKGSYCYLHSFTHTCISGLLRVSPEAMWNFSKGTRRPWTGIRSCGTEGPFLRLRCIGIVKAWTQLLICQSINLYYLNWCEHNGWEWIYLSANGREEKCSQTTQLIRKDVIF